jgi:predicted transcriptional regulator
LAGQDLLDSNSTIDVSLSKTCRLCDRQGCRSRAFPPLHHQLVVDPQTSSATPYRFEPHR